jgi:hypothetical protein
MKWMRGVLVTLTVLILVSGAVLLVLADGFQRHIADLRSRMVAEQQGSGLALPVLPLIVRAYAERAGGHVGSVRVVHAQHQATLATAVNTPPIPITADQWTGTMTPGIVWSAAGTMNALPVRVIDAFVSGKGELTAKLLGAIQVAGGTGPDYDKGELMRYLSELPVYPDAILNNGALTWEQLDPATVRVSASYADGVASVRFIFDAAGDILEMRSDDRPMTVDGRTVATPWNGIYGRYTQFGPYRIPAYGEVGWVLPTGLFTYWHGTVTAYEPVE